MANSKRLLLERRVTLADAIKVEPPWAPVLEFYGEGAFLVKGESGAGIAVTAAGQPWAWRGEWLVKDRGGHAVRMTEHEMYQVYEDVHLMVREEQE